MQGGLHKGIAMASKEVFLRDATGLVRNFSWVDVFFISAGGLGLGLAIIQLFNWVPYLFPGSNLSLMMLIGLVVVIFVGLAFVLFSVAMPRSGGDYIFVSRTLGGRLGFLYNLSLTVQLTGSVAVDTVLFTSIILSGALFTSGLATKNSGLQGLSILISQPQYGFVIGLAMLFFYAITVLVGGAMWKIVTRLFIVTGFASILLLTGILLITPHSAFVSAFNSLAGSTLTYDQVIPAAQKASFNVPVWTIAATIAGLPYAALFYLGFERGTYIAGETKRVQNSMVLGTFLSLGLGAIFLVALPPIMFNVVGENWWKSLLFLYYQEPKIYPLPIAPGPNLMAALAAPPVLVLVFAVVFCAWGMITSIGRFQVFSRCIFAWSFDRIIPTAFARVSERFHTPTYSILLFLGGTIIATVLAYFTNFLSFFLSTIGLGYALRLIVYVAAAVMPYRKNSKRIYQLSPLKPSILKVPLITIAGIVSCIFFTYMSYQTYSTLATRQFSFLLPAAISAIVLFGVLGLGIYQVAKMYWAKKGIDLGMAFRELPPE